VSGVVVNLRARSGNWPYGGDADRVVRDVTLRPFPSNPPSEPTSMINENHLLDRYLTLNPTVSIRKERFGALVYNHENRKLSFIRSEELLCIIEDLQKGASVKGALVANKIDPSRWPIFVASLSTLLNQGFVVSPPDGTGSPNAVISSG